MTGVIAQARMGSSRLPGKVMRLVHGKPLLFYLIERLRACRSVDVVVIATTAEPADDELARYAQSQGVEVFRGSEQDVLDRYQQAVKAHGLDIVVRVTADCPFLDPAVIDRLVERFQTGDYDLLHTGPSYPEGLDAEVVSRQVLDTAWREARLPSEREHVTAYLWNNRERFRLGTDELTEDLSHLRVVVDEPIDLVVVTEVLRELHVPGRPFGLSDIVELSKRRPEIFERNSRVVRNEGYLISLENDREAEDSDEHA